MRNRFPGKCHGCGEWVEAEAGHCKKVARVFRVACGGCHLAGDAEWAAIKKKAAEKSSASKTAPEGYVAITAKYPGKCGTCAGAVEAGAAIYWKRGDVRHADAAICADETVAATVAVEEGAPGHGPGCFGECDGIYDCSAPSGNFYADAASAGRGVSYEPDHFDEI